MEKQTTTQGLQIDADESKKVESDQNDGRKKVQLEQTQTQSHSQQSKTKTDGCDSECVMYEDKYEYIDVVWLKRDVRWTDHGPLSEVATGVGGRSSSIFRPTIEEQKKEGQRKFVILYLYEPDQLKNPSVHGSHLRFVHEGLVDMDLRLKEKPTTALDAGTARTNSARSTSESSNTISSSFEYLTVCHNSIISTLTSIHFRYLVSSISLEEVGCQKKIVNRKYYKIARLLAHEETGHWQSYMRDRSVRKWCKTRSIPFVEFNQTGVTRRLKDRDDYLKGWKAFMSKPVYSKPNLADFSRESFRSRLIQLDRLPKFISSPGGIANIFDNYEDDGENIRKNFILKELPFDHRADRPGRQQFGGETKAMGTLQSFLSDRGAKYSQGISSPNSAWNSCSRLSPYLTWGHISLRHVLKSLEERRESLREQKSKGRNIGTWLKSLQAFASRAHWRSHFIQKLESVSDCMMFIFE